MKTLMKKGGIGLAVSRLDGYLQALSDINDDHKLIDIGFGQTGHVSTIEMRLP